MEATKIRERPNKASPPPLTDEMRALYEHMRRQAIEDLRFCDLMLYGDKGHTVKARVR